VSNRKAIEKRMADRALARLGSDVWLRGVKYVGHILSEGFDDGSGFRYELALGIRPEAAANFNKNDSVFIDQTEYKIKRIPEYTNQQLLVNIEVQLVQS